MNKATRIAPPEFWRFFFILYICFLHFEEDVYGKTHLIANAGYLGVDFFLILSGFVVALNHSNRPINSVFKFASKRVERLYPDFLFALLLMFLLWLCFEYKGISSLAAHLYACKFQYFFVNAFVPTALEMRSIWFLSYWLFGIIILAYVLKHDKLVIAGAFAISFMSWHIYKNGSLFNDSAIPSFLWSDRFLKCISEVVIGALAYNVFLCLNKLKDNYKLSKMGKILLSLIELIVILYIVVIMSFDGRNNRDYEVCIGFCMLIILSFLNISYFSKFLDNKVSLFLGKISLPIYLYHLFVVKIVSVYWYTSDNKLVIYILTFAAILIASYLFHLFVETFFRQGLKYCFNKLVIKR